MSQLNPSEISSVLKEKISGLDLSSEKKNEGVIVSVSDGIVRLHGMGDVMYGELIEFENGVLGLALNLEQDSVGAVVLGDYLELIEGQKATCTGRILEVPVGEELLGRVVNTLGTPIDGKGEIKTKETAVSLVLISPLPSIGVPSVFTTLPRSSSPTGTSRILPVHVAF